MLVGTVLALLSFIGATLVGTETTGKVLTAEQFGV
jgi:hypothetical protein